MKATNYIPKDYIPKPCHENWNAMTGNEQKKFCDKCACSVHNLTGMNHDQIMNLKTELGGNLCGVFQTQTKASPENKPTKRRVHLRKSLLISASISSLALAACDSEKDDLKASDCSQPIENTTKPDILLGEVIDDTKPEVLMGGVCPEPEIKPPKVEPKIMGKIAAPPKEIKPPVKTPRIMGIVCEPKKAK